MKHIFLTIFTILVFSTVGFSQANSLEKEVLAFRTKVVESIKIKDEKSLQKIFADGYTHTHAIGKVDDKQTRLKVLLSGEETIDTVKPDNFSVKFFGQNLAVIQGQTTFQGAEKKVYQWTFIYQKNKGKWQIILSQASLKTI